MLHALQNKYDLPQYFVLFSDKTIRTSLNRDSLFTWDANSEFMLKTRNTYLSI